MVWESELSQQSSRVKAIDLRYPNGLAVSWKGRKSVAEIKLETQRNEWRKVTIVRG